MSHPRRYISCHRGVNCCQFQKVHEAANTLAKLQQPNIVSGRGQKPMTMLHCRLPLLAPACTHAAQKCVPASRKSTQKCRQQLPATEFQQPRVDPCATARRQQWQGVTRAAVTTEAGAAAPAADLDRWLDEKGVSLASAALEEVRDATGASTVLSANRNVRNGEVRRIILARPTKLIPCTQVQLTSNPKTHLRA